MNSRKRRKRRRGKKRGSVHTGQQEVKKRKRRSEEEEVTRRNNTWRGDQEREEERKRRKWRDEGGEEVWWTRKSFLNETSESCSSSWRQDSQLCFHGVLLFFICGHHYFLIHILLIHKSDLSWTHFHFTLQHKTFLPLLITGI